MKKLENIIYEDNHLLVVNKPAGLLVQGDKTGDITLLEIAKQYIKEKYNKPGNVYLGLVHRLDRPASGVIVFARTSKSASRLSKQFREKTIDKKYVALVEGKIPETGTLKDNILRNGVTSKINQNGKPSELRYKLIEYKNNISKIKIDLITGRHHQIRVQFANHGNPILGDFRYGSKIKFGDRAIALHSYSLAINHPVKKERMVFEFGGNLTAETLRR
ncbi:MAG: RNA pseudouridine synthase [Candidatus Marinimicrobia bacterium]|nr:RNA pseudouridine synthase [Candidatus Neomarinimicrobiota bacterium]